MSTLDSIERNISRDIAKFAAIDPQYSLLRTALVAFLIAPFALVNFMFIPMLGQAVVLVSFGLSCYYLRIKRSWLLLFSAIAGALLALSAMMLVIHFIFTLTGMLLFVLLGLSTAVMLSYAWLVYGAIWWHFDDAHRRYKLQNGGF